MAITIQEQPYSFTVLGQKLIYRCTSTNVANNGFRFVFKIKETASNNLIATIRVAPNTESTPQGILDLSPIIRNRIEPVINHPADVQSGIDESRYWVTQYRIEVVEGWIVSGVFTENAPTQIVTYHLFFNGQYNVSDGYRPNPANRYGLVNDQSLLMGSRTPSTHIPQRDIWGLNYNGKNVFIPTRNNDNGNLYYLTDETDVVTDKDSGISANSIYIKMRLIDGSGTEHTASYIPLTTGVVVIPAYPKSLSGTSDFLDPSDYAGWRYYTFQLFTVVGNVEVSAEYIFYPQDEDCIYPNTRLAWYDEKMGGYDYFNFQKLKEESIQVERTRVKRVVGNYTSAISGFTFNSTDRGLMDANNAISTYATITSDYIQEGEFELLKNLVKSKDVYIVQDNGVLIPILIEENSYTSQNKKNGKVYNITMRIRYSNEDL